MSHKIYNFNETSLGGGGGGGVEEREKEIVIFNSSNTVLGVITIYVGIRSDLVVHKSKSCLVEIDTI